jgi:hypothetical protein
MQNMQLAVHICWLSSNTGSSSTGSSSTGSSSKQALAFLVERSSSAWLALQRMLPSCPNQASVLSEAQVLLCMVGCVKVTHLHPKPAATAAAAAAAGVDFCVKRMVVHDLQVRGSD